MKPYRRSVALAAFAASAVLLGNTAFSQIVTGPVFEAGDGLTQLSLDHPLFDPYTFNYTLPAGPGGAVPLVRESLFNLSLTVTDTGSVDEVDVIDGFYDPRVLRSVRDAVKAARFTPATTGGAAVDYPQLHVRVIMRGAYAPGVSDAMRESFNELIQLVSAQDWQAAEKFATNLLDDDALRLFELALLKDQLATVYAESGRVPEAILASRMATARSAAVLPGPEATPEALAAEFPEEFLNAALYLPAQRKHFIVALLANQTGEALKVYDDLQAAIASQGQEAQFADVAAQAEALRTLLASDAEVGSAVVLVNGSWEFTMSNRRTFGVTGLDGEVNFIDVNCGASPARRMAFVNDSEWRIPDSWGSCTLAFKGKKDSRFNLYEYLN